MSLPWRAALGDGTYRNAVLNADWSTGERDAARPLAAPGGRAASGPVFTATPWRSVGAFLGLFATAPGSGHSSATPVGEGFAGTATFDDFRITA